MFSGIFLLLDLIFQTLIIWTGSLHFELINIFKEPALPAMSVLDSKNPCSQFAAQTVKPVYLMKTCYVMKAFFLVCHDSFVCSLRLFTDRHRLKMSVCQKLNDRLETFYERGVCSNNNMLRKHTAQNELLSLKTLKTLQHNLSIHLFAFCPIFFKLLIKEWDFLKIPHSRGARS